MHGAHRHLRAGRTSPAWAEPTRQDWLLLGGIVAVGLVEAALQPDLPWYSVALGLGLMPVVLWRRTRPLLMVAIAFVASSAISAVRIVSADPLPLLDATTFLVVLPFALVRRGSTRQIAIGTSIIAVAAALGFAAERSTAGEVVGGSAVLLLVFAMAAAVRYRAQVRLQEIEQAKLREREQIARDLHDTVAHHVSAIAVRAHAGLTAADRSDGARSALRDIAEEASVALADMRRMVHVLRDEASPERAPTPGVADLERLALAEGVGPKVEVTVRGNAADVGSTLATTLYRVAQEAVTNARRHALHASSILVDVCVGDAEVRLDVTDDGVASTHRRAGPGFGLVGMRERVEQLGGTVMAGPSTEGGWRVSVVLPRSAPQM